MGNRLQVKGVKTNQGWLYAVSHPTGYRLCPWMDWRSAIQFVSAFEVGDFDGRLLIRAFSIGSDLRIASRLNIHLSAYRTAAFNDAPGFRLRKDILRRLRQLAAEGNVDSALIAQLDREIGE